MASTDFHNAAHAGATTSGLKALWSNLRVAIARRRTFAQTKRELEALSNRELDDLGISRSMITRIAYDTAYGNN